MIRHRFGADQRAACRELARVLLAAGFPASAAREPEDLGSEWQLVVPWGSVLWPILRVNPKFPWPSLMADCLLEARRRARISGQTSHVIPVGVTLEFRDTGPYRYVACLEVADLLWLGQRAGLAREAPRG